MKTKKHHVLLLASAALLVLATSPTRAEADVAGVTAAVNPKVTAFDGTGKPRLISLGDPVIRHHRIETGSGGLVQILLADGTSFTIGPNSSVVIDSFVYDPEKNTASLAATMTKGALRFIGGRASKASGNVKIDTPIGTAGIRGAVVDINLNGQTSNGEPLPPHMTLVYGKEVRLSGQGAPQRLFKQGFSIIAGDGQPRIQRTPPQWVSGFQQALAGRPGQSGGANNRPTNQTVATSTVARSNSAHLPSENTIPVPQPRPVVTTPVGNMSGDSQRDVGPRPQVPDGGGLAVSVLSPVETDGGDGGPGSSAVRLEQLRGTLSRSAGGTLTGTDRAGNDVTLPALPSASVLTKQSVTGAVNGTMASGTAYTGSSGFFTYMLSAGSAEPHAVYVVGGTPADARKTLSTEEILSYVLEPDLLAALMNGDGQTIPFTGSFIDSGEAVASDLLAGGVSDASGDVAGRALQASLVINGSGAGQTSAINILSGSFDALPDGGYGLVASTAGSSRTDAIGGATNGQGKAASIGSTAGKDHFLGADGEYLVLAAGTIGETGSDFATPEFKGYEQVHVASRDDAETTGARRTFDEQTMTGFSSGVATAGGNSTVARGSTNLTFDAEKGTFEGRISTGSDDNFAKFDDDGDRSYLSDQLIAGSSAKDGSYLVSSAVVPATIFDSGDSSAICNACEFMTWGWWGRNVHGEINHTVHLGNWIIGKQPENSAIPSLGTATYNGNAVGTVVNGSAQYIATGAMTSTMDFGSRTGTVAVSGYDSKTFSADVSFGNGAATFSGSSSSGIATSVTGAFASDGTDPVKGIMGNFTATDGNWSSTGIFAGSK